MLPKDYVRMRLCRSSCTEVSDASGTLLLDVAARRWSDQMLEALQLPASWLPPVLESGTEAGRTADGVAVAAGAGDQAAGALGVGVDGPGPASVVLGTSGVVFCALPGFAADPHARVHAFCHAVPATWHAMGVMLSAAGSLQWLRSAVAPDLGYEQLVNEAEGWPAGTEGLLFVPYLAGERTPHADPDARGAFAGLSVRHDRGALTRAVLEGVAFGLRDSLDLIATLGEKPTLARVSGGGARSELWLQIVASALEIPLQRVAVDEGAAFGAAILGGVAAGLWDDVREGVAATVKAGETVEPVPSWVEAYREQRERYQSLYPALREVVRPHP
jgi:xylulokinase